MRVVLTALRVLLLALLCGISSSRASAAGAAESKTLVFPSEIRLISGATLRNCSPTRWTSDSVVVKHAGGVDPVRFTSIVESHRSAILAFRASAMTAPPAAEKAPASNTISGQVFVATRGAGSYKFSSATVYAYPIGELERVISARQFHRPTVSSLTMEIKAWEAAFEGRTPLASTRTDAEGKFSLSVPSNQPVFLACHAYRSLGKTAENNFWLVPVTAFGPVQLDGENCETY